MPKQLKFKLKGQGGPIWWVDKTGAQPWSEIQNYNFNLLPNAPNAATVLSGLTGSFLVSDPFHVKAGQSLTVNATISTAGFVNNNYNDVGFGILLQNGTSQYILFALRPDNGFQFGDVPIATLAFAKPTQPAGYSASPAACQLAAVLGGVDYAPKGQATTNFTSVCTPAPGKYQLLFGIFTLGAVVAGQPSALVLWSDSVS